MADRMSFRDRGGEWIALFNRQRVGEIYEVDNGMYHWQFDRSTGITNRGMCGDLTTAKQTMSKRYREAIARKANSNE